MESLLDEILDELTTELSLKNSSDIAILESKIRNAIREVKRIRNYQSHHTDEFIWKDMETMYPVIRNLALYDWNLIGAEGHISISENGISRTFVDRNSILACVVPFVSCF